MFHRLLLEVINLRHMQVKQPHLCTPCALKQIIYAVARFPDVLPFFDA
jgi:hypothetical protein